MSTENDEHKVAASLAAISSEKSAAQHIWDAQRGAEFVYVAGWLQKGKRSPLYVHELVYRVDVLEKDDPVLMVKAIYENQPMVAFVYSPGLLTGTANLAGLLRSGSLKWRLDAYPSRKVKEFLRRALEQ